MDWWKVILGPSTGMLIQAVVEAITAGERDAQKQRRAAARRRGAARLSRSKAVVVQEHRKRTESIAEVRRARGVDAQVKETLGRLARELKRG